MLGYLKRRLHSSMIELCRNVIDCFQNLLYTTKGHSTVICSIRYFLPIITPSKHYSTVKPLNRHPYLTCVHITQLWRHLSTDCWRREKMSLHDDVIIWKQFPRYWSFVRGIHRSPMNSPHKGQWRGALMFSLTCVWTKRLSKQSRRRWFETPSHSLWHYCNERRKWRTPIPVLVSVVGMTLAMFNRIEIGVYPASCHLIWIHKQSFHYMPASTKQNTAKTSAL